MPRPKLPEKAKKQRINITLDRLLYNSLRAKNCNLSKTINGLLRVWSCSTSPSSVYMTYSHSRGPGCDSRSVHLVRFGFSQRIKQEFYRFLAEKKYSQTHIKLCKKALKSVYKNSHLNIDINKTYIGWKCKGIRVICNFLASINMYPQEVELIRQHIKIIRGGIDSYVPTDEEIRISIHTLKQPYKDMYKILCFSGIRATELEYILKNDCRVICGDGFNKIYINYNRGSKNSNFAYIPTFLSIPTQATLNGLKKAVKRKKLVVNVKYCRKWFFTKCIELGIPESVADYYEGRTSRSIGVSHYLAKQSLADKFYTEKLLPYFAEFMLNRPSFSVKSTNPQEQKISL